MTTLGVKHEYAVCAGHRISSEVHFETTTGLLVGRTRTRSTVVWNGFQGAVQALVLGTGGAVLAAGPLSSYDIDNGNGRHHERTEIWVVWRVPSDVAERATETALVHTWNPRWPGNMRLTFAVSAIADLVSHTEMGDLAVGGEMAWPEDEMPWAIWADGRVRSGHGDAEIVALPRPLRVGHAPATARV